MRSHPIRPATPGALRARVRAARFVLVGGAAAGVHWGVVVVLVELAAWLPLWANLAGWLVAFPVSFAGHRCWTFPRAGVSLRRSARRFFVLSAGGFAANETAYALALSLSRWRYDLVLLAVLLAVAGVTYVLSRHWAFGDSPAH